LPDARIVVVISGQGRNLQALIEHCARGNIRGRIVAVISNRPDAGGLQRAQSAGIPTQVIPHANFATREAFDAALAEAIDAHRPDVVVLAGFMRVLGAAFIARFHGRLVNIHPSLLPRHPGLKKHERALAARDREHGASVHFVTPEVDGGPIAIQGRFSVRSEDTAQTLAERVMLEVEVRIFPQAVAWLVSGDLRLGANGVIFRGRALTAPLSLEDLDPEFR
jgi:phosphoribosylglycinamide formyltransferase 1